MNKSKLNNLRLVINRIKNSNFPHLGIIRGYGRFTFSEANFYKGVDKGTRVANEAIHLMVSTFPYYCVHAFHGQPVCAKTYISHFIWGTVAVNYLGFSHDDASISLTLP